MDLALIALNSLNEKIYKKHEGEDFYCLFLKCNSRSNGIKEAFCWAWGSFPTRKVG